MKPDGTFEDFRTDEEAKAIAIDLYQQLIVGADFENFAKEYSEDQGSRDNGGLYVDVPVSQWVPEFKQATLEQEIGKIGVPFKTDFGYHIIRVEKRNTTELNDIREQILSELAYEKLSEYVSEILPSKIIEINF
ncbi:MAG: peptidyl-prolyl cis-trans isomerase [Bacillaceae bacterium]|nr:peptidyl-prolyl cis-trans isomerase [Bacillaceae bacterium]